MKFLLLPLVAVLTPVSALAKSNDDNCPEGIDAKVQRFLKADSLSPNEQGGSVAAKTCKSWSYDQRFLLAAMAYDYGVNYEKSLLVAILDRRTLKIIAGYQSIIREDALTEVGKGSLQLDTAKYQLSPNVRAFGVRFTSAARGPSCADGASWDELTLFIAQTNKLRPVFQREMQFQSALRGCIGSATGHDVWEYGRRTISVAGTSSNGLADILITESVTVDGNSEPMPEDIDTKKKTRSYLMKYDGKEYR